MLHYRDEIQTGVSAARFFFSPSLESLSVQETQQATLRLLDATTRTSLLEAPLVFDEDAGQWNAVLNTSHEKPRLDVEMKIEWVGSQGTTSCTRPIALLADPWQPLIALEDLAAYAPTSAIERDQAEAELRRLVAVCEDELRLRCLSRGFPAGALVDKRALDSVLRLRVVAAYMARREPIASSAVSDAAASWQRRAESALNAILAKPILSKGIRGLTPPAHGPMRLSP